jgi:hypothetical protein
MLPVFKKQSARLDMIMKGEPAMGFKKNDLSGFCGRDRDENDLESSRRNDLEHVHEILGSVEIAERISDPHNHRFATVSGEAIRERDRCNDHEWDQNVNDIPFHVHEVKFRTDNYEDHYHEFRGKTGGPIRTGDRHVHFLESTTFEADGHVHDFRVTSLIENPIEEDHKKKKKCKTEPW